MYEPALLPHGIMFHHFHSEALPRSQGSISAEDLARIVESYAPNRILPARDWFDKAVAGTLSERDTCLTFDDALLCQHEVALPVLEQYGLTAFWFVNTSVCTGGVEMPEIHRTFRHRCFEDVSGFYDCFSLELRNSKYQRLVDLESARFDASRYLGECPFYTTEDKWFRFVRDEVLDVDAYNSLMDRMMIEKGFDMSAHVDGLWIREEQLKELHSNGHVVGLHTHTHPMTVAKLPPVEQEREYSTNHEVLYALLGEPPQSMAHPANSYSETTLDILRRLGVRLGFRAAIQPSHGCSRLEFPREDHANIMKALRV